MSLAQRYKATYDYVELTVEQSAGQWRLTLKDNRHGVSVVHDEEFATAADARDKALPMAQHHIHVEHNDTLLGEATLDWKTY